LAQQSWSHSSFFRHYSGGALEGLPVSRCACVSCGEVSIWYELNKLQIHPRLTSAPMPHNRLPADCKGEYLEARNIAQDSPRAAAALLRLCVQKLLISLGGQGKKIDADIAQLVAKGLPNQVTQALDICRVVGNNAVHPGEIVVNDDPELVGQLFGLINFIVDQTLEREAKLSDLMAKLPSGALSAIAKRDAKALSAGAAPAPQS
jgi:hypothetical protein